MVISGLSVTFISKVGVILIHFYGRQGFRSRARLEITFNASDRMPVVIERPTGCRGESRKPEARRKCQDIDEFIFPSSFTNPLSHSFVISLTSSSCLSSLGESNPPKFPFFQSDPFLHRIVNNLYLRLRILIPSPLPSKRGRGRVSKRKKKRRRKKERLGDRKRLSRNDLAGKGA